MSSHQSSVHLKPAADASRFKWLIHGGVWACCHASTDNIPFFTMLDHRSKIMICSKLVFCSYKPYDITSIDSDESGAGACITIEGQRGADMYLLRPILVLKRLKLRLPGSARKSQKRFRDTPRFKFQAVLARIQPFSSCSIEKAGRPVPALKNL